MPKLIGYEESANEVAVIGLSCLDEWFTQADGLPVSYTLSIKTTIIWDEILQTVVKLQPRHLAIL